MFRSRLQSRFDTAFGLAPFWSSNLRSPIVCSRVRGRAMEWNSCPPSGGARSTDEASQPRLETHSHRPSASNALPIAGSDAYAGGPRWTAGSSYFTSSAKGKPITQTAQLDAESETSQSIPVIASLCPVTLQVTDAFGHPMAALSSLSLRLWTNGRPFARSMTCVTIIRAAVN